MSILPSNAGAAERALDIAGQRISALPTNFNRLLDPNFCLPEWLPFMAWHMGIQFWNSSWSVSQQREVYAQVIYLARLEGTPASVHRVLQALDIPDAELADRFEGFELGVSELGIEVLRSEADHFSWEIVLPDRTASEFEVGLSEAGIDALTDFQPLVKGGIQGALEALRPAHTTLHLE